MHVGQAAVCKIRKLRVIHVCIARGMRAICLLINICIVMYAHTKMQHVVRKLTHIRRRLLRIGTDTITISGAT